MAYKVSKLQDTSAAREALIAQLKRCWRYSR
jgi:hypothetical protein